MSAAKDSARGSPPPSRITAFVKSLGVPVLPPRISPFDPGYDSATVESHLRQSGHLMSRLKLSMAQWLIAGEESLREKIAAAKGQGVPLVTGGGPFEIAQARGCLEGYFELCASLGIDRIEVGEGFTRTPDPEAVVGQARSFGLEVQAEIGEKQGGPFRDDAIPRLVERGLRWLNAGALQVVIEARESAQDVGLFDSCGTLDLAAAETFATAFGLERTVFEAPNKRSQFEMLTHFGGEVYLGNVRLEELLRVEIFRRGLHADSFGRILGEQRQPAQA